MIKTILVPIDIHEESSWQNVLPIAIDHARRYDADLHMMTVVPHVELNMPGVLAPEKIYPQLRDAAQQRLETIIQPNAPADLRIHYAMGEGNVHREILRVAEEIEADLIILASHRPALSTYLLGAHAARVVRHAQCSVYVVRPC